MSDVRFKCYADVVELVDTLDLGSSAARCESSSLSVRTIVKKPTAMSVFFCLENGWHVSGMSERGCRLFSCLVTNTCFMQDDFRILYL